MKHKHYEMIVAKAANIELTVFYRYKNDEWEEASSEMLVWDIKADHFLCLPQHKDACLHWLNGGEVEVSGDGERWEEYNLSVEYPKYPMTDFTGYEFQFRIKPKKEKRWIAVNSDGYVMPVHCGNIESARQHASHIDSRLTENVQFIEIEVEV